MCMTVPSFNDKLSGATAYKENTDLQIRYLKTGHSYIRRLKAKLLFGLTSNTPIY